MTAETRLKELGLELPAAPEPRFIYKGVVVVGNLAFVSGHAARKPDGSLVLGKLGRELDEDAGCKAARQTALAMLSTLRSELGSLDRVRRLVKVLAMVNCTPDFGRQPAVINCFSQVLADVFGPEAGIGARSTVGIGSFGDNIPLEIEAIFEVQ